MVAENKQNQHVEELNYGRSVFHFLKFGPAAFWISMILMTISIFVIFIKGFNLGQDFTGGTTVEITVNKTVNLDDIRNSLQTEGYKDSVVQYYGSSKDIIIRLPLSKVEEQTTELDNTLGNRITHLLQKNIDSNATIKRIEFVGPTVGAELAQDGILAICAALICILIYIAFRFEWRFGTGAVVALVHDVVITAGYLSFFNREVDLTIIAAILSVIGYSLNDTIVVFDRIRENFRKIRRAEPSDVINVSLTQTLTRTLMTSGTTLAVVIILYLFGGNLLKGFAETLGVGILLGTISSIYVAAYMSLKLGVKREYFIVQKVEAEGADQPTLLR